MHLWESILWQIWLYTGNAAAKSLQSCPTLCDPIDGSPPGSRPWDSLGKNTGMGCHFLLQCMKVKSESEVAQWCLTLSDPLDCSLPGSSVHGICQARVLEWAAITFSELKSLVVFKVFSKLYSPGIFKTTDIWLSHSYLIYLKYSLSIRIINSFPAK